MMILNVVDYLIIPVRFGQTGEIIHESNLWLELYESPSESGGPTLCRAGAKHLQTQQHWGFQNHIITEIM